MSNFDSYEDFVRYRSSVKPYVAYYKLSFGENKTNCKGLCETKLNGIKGKSSTRLYANGYLYCRRCEFFFETKKQFCECCGMKLRRKPKDMKRAMGLK